MDYMSIQDINFSYTLGASNPYLVYAGAHSTNGGNNAGIAFIDSSKTAYRLTTETSWTVPSDWNSSNNTVYMLGGGGGGSGGDGNRSGSSGSFVWQGGGGGAAGAPMSRRSRSRHRVVRAAAAGATATCGLTWGLLLALPGQSAPDPRRMPPPPTSPVVHHDPDQQTCQPQALLQAWQQQLAGAVFDKSGKRGEQKRIEKMSRENDTNN